MVASLQRKLQVTRTYQEQARLTLKLLDVRSGFFLDSVDYTLSHKES